MNKPDIKTTPGGTVYSSPDAVRMVQALVLRRALRLYADTGIKPNRAYNPMAMLSAASQITGKTYQRGEYLRAAQDLQQWSDAMAGGLYVQHKEQP